MFAIFFAGYLFHAVNVGVVKPTVYVAKKAYTVVSYPVRLVKKVF